ncbi:MULTISPECIES: hypothetical protein [unclassified Streptomyces]|uniref:hypothetical protein n=1 Tax=unclassified Streptomyces TaxID=2593676 RepID=UPI0021C5D0CF|nr:hypothetical protein [Streptomyces sp. FIT100]UUN30306.1 hypothetical protein KK483_31120 [Streptomyces sp. FIT100]
MTENRRPTGRGRGRGRGRDPSAASIALRVLGGLAATLLALAVVFHGFVMGLEGTHCETVLVFVARCDPFTRWTVRILMMGVVPVGWITAMGGLFLPSRRARRYWWSGMLLMLTGWSAAALIAYR